MADDYFLKIDGIEGESQDARHKGEIELDAWSFGGTAEEVVGGTVGRKPSGPTRPGAASGRFTAQDFQFTAKVSKASPKLFEACATGALMKDLTLFARKAGTEQQDYLKIRLSDVVISSYQQSGAREAEAVPLDQASCHFASIEMEYRPMNADGSLGNPVKVVFDVKAKRPL